jgi:hypothetical protein
MTRDLPKDNEGDQWLQFRGRQTSVTADDFGILFTTEFRDDRRVHKPLPVVDEDDPDPPANAVVRPVADELVDSNPLVGYGIACEEPTEDGVCGEVFASPKALDGHKTVHNGDADPLEADDDTEPGDDAGGDN